MMSAKEAVGALGELRHRPAELALVERLKRLESEMIARGGNAERCELADRICAALARHGSVRAIRAVAAHAYNRAPALGDALARFESLSRLDLTIDPRQLDMLLKSIRDLTSSKVLRFRRQAGASRAVLPHAGGRGDADDRSPRRARSGRGAVRAARLGRAGAKNAREARALREEDHRGVDRRPRVVRPPEPLAVAGRLRVVGRARAVRHAPGATGVDRDGGREDHAVRSRPVDRRRGGLSLHGKTVPGDLRVQVDRRRPAGRRPRASSIRCR